MKLNFKIAQLALPLILSNLTVPLLGLVNTTVVGHLKNSHQLAAVGLGSMIFNVLYWGSGFLRMGTTGLVSQTYGQGNESQSTNIVLHSLIVALCLASLFLLFQVPIEKLAFWLIHSSGQVRAYTQDYYFARIWAAPAVLINYVLIGTFIGIQKTRPPLVMMTVVNITAMLFDLLLVWYWHFGAQGVAIADVIGQYSGLATACYLLTLKQWIPFTRLTLSLSLFKHLIQINRDILLRTLCLILGFSFFTAQSARLGVTVLAANTLLLNFQMFLSYALDGFANVTEMLVGKSIGARNYKELLTAIYDTGTWALLVSLLFTCVYAIGGTYLVALMTSIPDVYHMAFHYLGFVIIAPIISVWCFLFDGIYIGANQFAAMRNTMLIALLGYFALWWLLSDFNNVGLWFAFLSFFLLRGMTMAIFFVFRHVRQGFGISKFDES